MHFHFRTVCFEHNSLTSPCFCLAEQGDWPPDARGAPESHQRALHGEQRAGPAIPGQQSTEGRSEEPVPCLSFPHILWEGLAPAGLVAVLEDSQQCEAKGWVSLSPGHGWDVWGDPG